MIRSHFGVEFASLVYLFEDAHAIMVEGREADLSPDLVQVLLGNVRERLSQVERVLGSIEAGLS